MGKETWYSFLRDEAQKERKKRERRERKQYRANTKAFRTPQTFGPASDGTRKNYDGDREKSKKKSGLKKPDKTWVCSVNT